MRESEPVSSHKKVRTAQHWILPWVIRSHMRSCLRRNGKTQRENDDSSLHFCIGMGKIRIGG